MPTKERVADMTVTTTQLAAVLGITNRRVQQLTQDGVLTTVSRGKFVLGDAVQAYNASSEDVAAMTSELIYTVRGALMALPSRVAINAAALSDPAEVAEYMRGEVNQIAEEIAMFRYDPAKYEARVRERKAWAEKLAGDDDE